MKLCPKKNLSLPSKAPRSVLPSTGNDFAPSCEVRATVPVASGIVMVRAEVGSVKVIVVLVPFCVAPSD